MRFEDQDIWQDSQSLAVEVYTLTKKFPKDKQFSLTNQIKRAVTGISANFAEGYGRSSKKDKAHFYTIAYGSLLETKNFLYLAVKLGFCGKENIMDNLSLIESLQKRLNELKRTLNARP